jgi:hypothetical protein
VTELPNDVLEVSISPLNHFYLPVRTYYATETDKQLAYFPYGNQKYAVYTVDTTIPLHPRLEVQLKIAGQTVWNKTFSGKAVNVKSSVEKGRGIIEKGWEWVEQVFALRKD